MRRGVVISVGLHALLGVLTIAVFPSFTPDLPPIPPNIPVELVTIGDVTNIKKIDKVDEPKPEEKPAEPEPEPPRQVAALPPAPDIKPAPEPIPPPPEVKLEPEVKPEEKKAEEKKPEPPKPEKKPAPPEPPEPPKKKEPAFDASKIAALLNKLPPKEKSTVPGEQKQVVTGPQKTEAAGAATDMTATWQAVLQEQFKRCWNLQGGAQDAEKQIVVVHVELNPDGSLARPPELADPGAVALGGPTYQVAAERALRAVRACDPLKQLPADRYSDWREIDFVFDPRRMLGG